MKKRVCLLAALIALVVMGFAMNVEAAEIIDRGYCGGEGDGKNLTWTLDSDGVLVIEGQGEMKDWIYNETDPESHGFELADWHKHYEEINSVIVRDGVTSIGDYAFAYCENLSSIVLPESLTTIKDCVCSCCSNLENIDLPKSLMSMGMRVFEECRSLSSINLPDSLTTIETMTFYCCTNLSSVNFPKSLTEIGFGVFYCCPIENVDLPESLKIIGSWAFYYCSSLNTIDLPESVTSIGQWAFYSCYGLRSIHIPLSVEEIYEDAFLNAYLEDIYYAGSMEEWNSINILQGSMLDGFYDGFSHATVHYNSLPLSQQHSLDASLIDAASYNKDLAVVAANLSSKVVDDVDGNESVEHYLANNHGFDGGSYIYSDSYGETFAYTLATRKYYGTDTDGNTDILLITAQCSSNPYEMIPEAVSQPDYDNKEAFGGHVPYDIVEEYYTVIVEDLRIVAESGKHYKVLVTGHGLAGAVANLVAGNLSDGRIEGVETERADVFCYTFGALNPLDENAVIKENYENIHNVYNIYDTFSPLQYGLGEGFGMFGQIHLFGFDNRTSSQRTQSNDESVFRYVYRQIYQHVNHDMETCCSYVEGVKDGQNDLITEKSANHASIIIGLVDVDVYCDDKLVGRVANNTVDAAVSTIDIRIEGDSKIILYPDDRQYEIRIKALDEGKMTFGQIDLTSRGETKVIKDVSMANGKLFSGTVGGGRTAGEFKLYETDKTWKVLSEAQGVGNNVDLVRLYKLMSFAPRLYRNFLKREPDETGLGDWVDALYSGRGTGAKIVSGFVLSKEYQSNFMSDEEYVTAMYRIIFNREPDYEGLNNWITVLDNGCTNKKILEGFIKSDEFFNLCKDLGIEVGSYKSDEIADNNYLVAAFVARLYRLCLGRRYERKGLDNWVRVLVNGNATASKVVRGFLNSKEFQDRYIDDELFVCILYETILDRDPDESGLRSWKNALDRSYTRDQVIDGFLKSTEFDELCKTYGIESYDHTLEP